MNRPLSSLLCLSLPCCLSACFLAPAQTLADIVAVGGAVVMADPPATIIHSTGAWESNAEIRAWHERSLVLPVSLTLGHVATGPLTNEANLVDGVVPVGATVSSFMVRVDPLGGGPVLLSGFVVFDTPILGVYIGSQLTPNDDLLGRPGVTYNENIYRGMELDGNGGPSLDMLEISADRLRIDFICDVGDWTDDIRIITGTSLPVATPGGACTGGSPAGSIAPGQWESSTEIRTWYEQSCVLVTPLAVEHTGSGFIDDATDLIVGPIPAGTAVCSHFVRLDPVGNGPVILTGSLTFETPILGVLLGAASLQATDAQLGRSGVQYNTNPDRGLECDGPGGSADSFMVSPDRRQITFAFEVGGGTDDLRIIVATTAAFLRGDANRDGVLNLVDAIRILGYLFSAEPADCLDALDVNDSGAINLVDPIALLGYLFSGGPAPAHPFPASGHDLTPDPLGCQP